MQPTLETMEEIVERIKKTMLESRNNDPNQPGELKIIIAKVRDTLSTDHRIIFFHRYNYLIIKKPYSIPITLVQTTATTNFNLINNIIKNLIQFLQP